MKRSPLRTAMVFALCAGALYASAETRKAGLWEVTSTLAWQKSPPASASGVIPSKAGTHTSQVCLTQEMIDKYGALLPRSRGQCAVSNKVLGPGSVTADYVCSGTMSGKGVLKSIWSDSEHATGTLHFVGTFMVGVQAQPIEWTTTSTYRFKSESCGSIKPQPLPQAKSSR